MPPATRLSAHVSAGARRAGRRAAHSASACSCPTCRRSSGCWRSGWARSAPSSAWRWSRRGSYAPWRHSSALSAAARRRRWSLGAAERRAQPGPDCRHGGRADDRPHAGDHRGGARAGPAHLREGDRRAAGRRELRGHLGERLRRRPDRRGPPDHAAAPRVSDERPQRRPRRSAHDDRLGVEGTRSPTSTASASASGSNAALATLDRGGAIVRRVRRGSRPGAGLVRQIVTPAGETLRLRVEAILDQVSSTSTRCSVRL